MLSKCAEVGFTPLAGAPIIPEALVIRLYEIVKQMYEQFMP